MSSSLGAITGGILGYAAGYFLLVDEIGRIGHRWFWEAVLGGRLTASGIEEAINSETFWQVSTPAAIGLIIGSVIGGRLDKAKNGPTDQSSK